MSSSHSNLSHPLRIPRRAERRVPEDLHPASLRFQGLGGSTELLPISWQQGQCLEKAPQQLEG